MRVSARSNANVAGATLVLGAALFFGSANEILAAPTTLPTGLNPGDQYRLAFVTSATRDSTSSNIADYNDFVTATANAVPELLALGTPWTAIASTSTTDARDNTGTDPGSEVGVGIYLLNDTLIAVDNIDLWDGYVSVPFDVTEVGTKGDQVSVWTGTQADGTADSVLGVGLSTGGSTAATQFQWIGYSLFESSSLLPIYAISATLTVVPEPGTATLLTLGLIALTRIRSISQGR